VKLTKSPAIDIGPHCNKPYPCDFQGHCWKHIPKNSIFDLQWLSEEQKFELYSKKILLVEEIPDDFLSDPVQKTKLHAHKTSTPFFDKEFIHNFIEKIKYPLCFLKVWYHRPAVPLFEGTRPYEKLPFCVCLGMKQDKDSPLELNHHFFEPENNPLPEFQKLLQDVLCRCPTIITFYDRFPGEFSLAHNLINQSKSGQHFFDLHDVFDKNLYYNPKTNGDTRLAMTASVILDEKKALRDFYNSEIEAAIAYVSGQGSENEYSNFRRTMQQTSAQHLAWMEGIFGLLAGNHFKLPF
jgi:hypothetical protein